MTKELEALETFNYIMTRCKDEDNYIIKFPLGIQKGTTFGEDMEKAYKIIKEALQRLEAIENANPSEALEMIDKFKGIELSPLPFKSEDGAVKEVDLNEVRFVGSQLNNDFHKFVNTLENYILKAQEDKKILDILKRIIKVKPSDLYDFILVVRGTDEEENTIKEWLEKNE